MIVSEIYSVEDCIYYRQDLTNDITYDSGDNYELNTPVTLPNSFEIEFTAYRSSSTNGVTFIRVGTKSSTYDIGSLRNKGSLSLRRGTGSDLLIDVNSNNVIALGSSKVTYSYNGTAHTLTAGTTTRTYNETTSIATFWGIAHSSNCSVSNVKIKPL